MNNIQFLKEEIKMILDGFPKLEDERKEALMKLIDDESEDNLLELLKVLYKMRRDFIQAQYKHVEATDEYIKNLKSKNE